MARGIGPLLLALLLLSLPARAQLAPGEPFLPEGQIRVNDFWFRQNALMQHAEWVSGPDSVRTWLDLEPSGTRIPLLVFRRGPHLNLQAGAQRTLLRDALLDPLSLRGLRVDGDVGPLRLGLSGGETMDTSLPASGEQYRHVGLSVSTRLGRRGSAGLFASAWSPLGIGASHTVLSASADPNLRGPARASGAWGVDFADPGLPLRDRRAFRWEASWYGPRLALAARQQAHGRAYGPAHAENFRQGNDTFTMDGRLQILPDVELSENWQRFRYESPAGQPLVTARQESLQTQLSWVPRPGMRLAARHRSLLAGSGSAPDERQTADNVDFWWTPAPEWFVSLGYEGTRGDALASRQLTAGLNFSATPQDRLGFTYARGTFGLGAAIQPLEQSGVSYQRLLGDSGRLRAEYRVSSGQGVTWSTATLGADVRPDARWRVSAAASRSQGGALQNSTVGVELGYLLDEHTELALDFQSNPILAQGGAAAAPQWVTLRLNQSWGGGLEDGYRRRLRPRVNVVARYRAADGDWLPLEGARVDIDGVSRSLSAGGTAELDVDPGSYVVRLDTARLGPNYEVAGGDRRPVRLGAADREEVRFDVTAWSSVRAVVFQDLDGTGTPPVGYVPVTEVPIRLDGETALTGADGAARFGRRAPGTVRVELGELPAGIVPTTPGAVEAILEPGQDTVVVFGVRGLGRLRGAVRMVPRGEFEPGPGPAGVHLVLRGRRLGTSGPGGTLDLEAPAGRLELDVDASELGQDAYLAGPLPPVELAPDGEAMVEPVLALRAGLTVRLVRRGVPLPLEGVPVFREGGNFLYTDAQGQAVFRRLPMGPQEVRLSREHLPAGHRLVGPERRKVDLSSGDRAVVEFEVESP